MARVYVQRFDREEARRLRADGATFKQIADGFGVTSQSVREALATPQQKARLRAYSRNYMRQRYRQPCIRGCGRIAWHGPSPDRRGVCVPCATAERTRTVRNDSLRCSVCETWKPDAEFSPAPSRAYRRGRSDDCRACNAARRRALRERRKVPCVKCGSPRLPRIEKSASRARAHIRDTGLCYACYQASRRAA